MANDMLFFNGIDPDTGAYLLPPMPPEEFAKIVRGVQQEDNGFIKQVHVWLARKLGSFLGVKAGVNPKELSEAGWGLIFAADTDPAVREALSPLREHRKNQAGDHYREYLGEKAFRPDDTKAIWLARQGAASDGPVDPDQVPYYLLIIGDPQAIPYQFQYQLDVQYAVGRVHFDSLAEYDQYARSVVAAETGKLDRLPKAVFFGVKNQDDPATGLSANELVGPLAEFLDRDRQKWKDAPKWAMQTILGEAATKERLSKLLGGEDTPALLFTASHGLGGFLPGDPRQVGQQGALICQDWPGPEAGRGKALSPDYFLTADNISDDARLGGLIAFHFACYGAGVPQWDNFGNRTSQPRREIAKQAFISALPKRLLGHPRGGALAVIGHVERAWGYSFLGQNALSQMTRQLGVYQSTLTQIMQGIPIGLAMEFFNQRFAELAVGWKEMQDDISFGKMVSDTEVSDLWIANNDARNFVIVGDPAVRLAITVADEDHVESLQPGQLPRSSPGEDLTRAQAVASKEMPAPMSLASTHPGQ